MAAAPPSTGALRFRLLRPRPSPRVCRRPEGDRIEGRAGDVRTGRPPREPRSCRGRRDPSTEREPGESRDEEDAVRVVDRGGEGLDVLRRSMRPRPCGATGPPNQPRRPSPPGRTSRPGRFELPPTGREEAVVRRADVRARVQEQECAGPVGVLGLPWREARLAERRRLLVASERGDGDRAAEVLRRRLAEVAGRRADVREDLAGDADDREQLVVPGEVVDVEEQGPAGVRDVDRVDGAASRSAAREPPEKEGITVPKRQSPRSARARAPGTASRSPRSWVR